MAVNDLSIIGLLSGIFVAAFGAAIAIITKIVQDQLAEKRENRKLISLIRGELSNVRRHCLVVRTDVIGIDPRQILSERLVDWQKRKLGDLSFINNNIAKLGFVDEETVALFLQLALVLRNNDLEIDRIVDLLRDPQNGERYFAEALRRMESRMSLCIDMVNTIMDRRVLSVR